MPFMIIARDRPDSAPLRTELRPAHLAHLDRHAARLLAAGPLLGEDGGAPCGSLIVLDTDDRAEVDAFLAADPYTTGGLFAEVEVRPWRKVFLGGKKHA
jgi:uncharacterized protein YciI